MPAPVTPERVLGYAWVAVIGEDAVPQTPSSFPILATHDPGYHAAITPAPMISDISQATMTSAPTTPDIYQATAPTTPVNYPF